MRGVGRIAYIYPKPFFFVLKDIEGLSARYRVHGHRFTHGSAWLLPIDLLFQFVFLVRARSSGVRIVVAHFAGHHTVLPTLLGFRTFIVVAGSDACSFPAIRYGGFRKPWMRWSIAFSMRRAAALLPVHAGLERFSNTYSDLGPKEQGYARFVMGLGTPSIEVPYGFDVTKWSGPDGRHDPKHLLCVAQGAVCGDAVHFRKGIDLILDVAARLPDCRFTLVGLRDRESYVEAPSNVTCLGLVAPDRLRGLLLTCGVYLQPSVMEGWPNALCEAMLMGCVPIVSRVTSMPSIVGDLGAIVGERDPGALLAAIRKVHGMPEEMVRDQRSRARERILRFTLEERMAALVALIEGERAHGPGDPAVPAPRSTSS